jgi:GGDEF domain-containing protein
MSNATARRRPIRTRGHVRHVPQHGQSSALALLRNLLGLAPAIALDTGARPPVRFSEEHRLAQFAAGDRMLRAAANAGSPITVVLVELHDLPELEYLFGARVARTAVAKTSASLRQMAGGNGLVLQIDAMTSAVLLPELEAEGARARMHSSFGRLCCVEFESDGEDIVLVPDVALKTVEGKSVSFERLYRALRKELEDTRAQAQRRDRYLQRERESHSRPMELAAANGSRRTPAAAVAGEIYPRIPHTIAMPLHP